MLFHCARSIRCSLGASKTLGDTLVHHVASNDLKRSSAVLVVTDKGILKTGIELPALQSLKDEGFDVIVFDGVLPNPPERNVHDALQLCKDVNAKAVVGLGGGSSMDVAKLVAFLGYPGQKQRLEDLYGVGMCRGPRLPLVQIPTTAGTGSEVTPVSIITTGQNEKKGVVSSQLIPDVALLDGNLTLGLPRETTAMTGIDAMVHAIEAMTSRVKMNALSDMFAREGLKALGANIRGATGSESGNGKVREAMLLGSMYAGMAFANAPVGAVHALAYPIGTLFDVPHGLSISLVLPPILRFNAARSNLATDVYAEAADILFPDEAALESSKKEKAELLASKFEALAAELGLKTRLRDVGISEVDVAKLSDDAMKQSRLLPNNPADVRKEDCFALYRSVL